MRTYRLLFPLVALVPVAVLHCGDDDAAPGTSSPDAATTSSSSGNTSSSGSTSGGTTSSSSGSPSDGECGTTKVCFDIELADAGAGALRVAVLWAQLDDDGKDPEPELVFDQEVPAGATTFEVPLSGVKAPTDEKNLLCQRAGTDEAVSPCQKDPKIGYGVVIAWRDKNGDGKPQASGAEREVLGRGNVIFGYSDKAYDGVNWPDRPQFWSRLWPQGIDQGVHIYQGEKLDGGFDRPVKSKAGTRNKIAEKGLNLS